MKPKLRAVVILTATLALACLLAAVWWEELMWKLILTSVILFMTSVAIAGSTQANRINK